MCIADLPGSLAFEKSSSPLLLLLALCNVLIFSTSDLFTVPLSLISVSVPADSSIAYMLKSPMNSGKGVVIMISALRVL